MIPVSIQARSSGRLLGCTLLLLLLLFVGAHSCSSTASCSSGSTSSCNTENIRANAEILFRSVSTDVPAGRKKPSLDLDPGFEWEDKDGITRRVDWLGHGACGCMTASGFISHAHFFLASHTRSYYTDVVYTLNRLLGQWFEYRRGSESWVYAGVCTDMGKPISRPPDSVLKQVVKDSNQALLFSVEERAVVSFTGKSDREWYLQMLAQDIRPDKDVEKFNYDRDEALAVAELSYVKTAEIIQEKGKKPRGNASDGGLGGDGLVAEVSGDAARIFKQAIKLGDSFRKYHSHHLPNRVFVS
uniref:Uncharacterized protein n=1 Tax=Chromera velia CCMP2878 TaxID=1169474 RepID=A0A0G4HG88_9ALVE|eukprot:Cvel_27319.t1-p1 / transcript=Cvel_27319.t1 / gene=Cvel_27319 / organism=Chromera_velia_CCMP2878 / gene_product=hypothetical protein / transcript_product=hypothetical protein / location=Cvel_scaffold3388:3267-4163(-) / protein_length=299 / sequence_SO=supercontig / SO=protein_coding / is_pseudo=false